MILKQSADNAVVGNINVFRRWLFRKSRHCHDVAGQNNHKAGSCADLDLTDGDREVLGCAELFRVVGEAVLRFGDADRTLSEAEVGQRL